MDAGVIYWIVALSLDAVLVAWFARDASRRNPHPRGYRARFCRWLREPVDAVVIEDRLACATALEDRLDRAVREAWERRLEDVKIA